MRGKFLVIDGLDGSGKGVYLEAMQEAARKDGKRILDLHEFWKREGRHPREDEFEDIDLIFSSEPTFVGAGHHIRFELVREGRGHSAREIAVAFSNDRQVLYEQVLIPALRRGIGVIQSRSVSTSIVYQPLDAARRGEELTLAEVEALPGNRLALSREWAPDLLVIPTVQDVNEVIRRLSARAKQDEATFEKFDFQLRAKEGFESEWFKSLYMGLGTKVVYADGETSIEKSKSEAVRLYRELFG